MERIPVANPRSVLNDGDVLACGSAFPDAVDVIEDPEAFEEMERLSGQTLAPVIAVDGQVLADFGARELVVFWEGLGKSK